jgi:hypothetical protein
MTLPAKGTLLRLLRQLDAEGGGCVLLKNVGLWASFDRGGDWDLAVGDLALAARVLVSECGPPRLLMRRSYVTAFFYDWGEIDLVSHFGWRGAELLDIGELRGGANRTTEKVAVARPAHQAIAGWVLPLLYAGSFRTRYQDVVTHALESDGAELERVLTRAFGIEISGRLVHLAAVSRLDDSVQLSRAMRRACQRRSLRRHPLGTLSGAVRHLQRELALGLAPQLPAVNVGSDFGVRDAIAWSLEHGRFIRGVVIAERRPRYLTLPAVAASASASVVDERRDAPPRFTRWWRHRVLRSRGWIVVRPRRRRAPRSAMATPDVAQVREAIGTRLDALVACTAARSTAGLIGDVVDPRSRERENLLPNSPEVSRDDV